jgi:hypothetical protein
MFDAGQSSLIAGWAGLSAGRWVLQRLLRVFAIGWLLATPVVAQRGGGSHGGMGGGFHGGMGGGFRGGMGGGFHGGMGGGFRGGMGGGFHGGGFAGPGRGYPGFRGGFYRRGFNGSRFYWGYYPWGYWPYYYGGWGYPSYGYYNYPSSVYSYPYYDYGYAYGGSSQDQPAWPQTSQTTIYLIKLKEQDNVCVAQAYWYTNQTLHFVTLEGEHKQVPVTSIDRALTLQLNNERHVEFQLPPSR